MKGNRRLQAIAGFVLAVLVVLAVGWFWQNDASTPGMDLTKFQQERARGNVRRVTLLHRNPELRATTAHGTHTPERFP